MLTTAPEPLPVPSGDGLADDFLYFIENQLKSIYAGPLKSTMETHDTDALRTYASSVLGSECIKARPMAHGGFNILYFLGFLDGREAIARVNLEVQTNDQTLLRDRLVSEASTLRYIKTHLSVPVPTVYGVNDQLPNPIGGRCLIEDRVFGRMIALYNCTAAQRKTMLTQIFRYEAALITARFTSIGSIYSRAEDNTFYVGPMGPTICRPLNHSVDRGPWTCTRDWLKAYVKSELSHIQGDPEQYRETRKNYKLDNGDPTFSFHVAWLKTLAETMDQLEFLRSIPAAIERPVLVYEDLSGGNVLFSYPNPTELVGIVDWEGARVIPLWSALDDPNICRDLHDPNELSKLRLEILCEADPACADAQPYLNPLRRLRWLAFMGITSWWSTEKLCQSYSAMKAAWPVDEPAFTALDKVVALAPSGDLTSE